MLRHGWQSKILADRTQNIDNVCLDEALKAINHEFINTRLNGLCYQCPAYRARVIDKAKINIRDGYVVLKNRLCNQYLIVPKKLSSLPDDVLIYMFQNNLVAKMKADKILDY